jgi:hypothetical protein
MAKRHQPRFHRVRTAALPAGAREEFARLQELLERAPIGAATRKAYTVTARHLVAWLAEQGSRVGDLTPERVGQFLDSKEPGAAGNLHRSAMRLLLGELVKAQMVDSTLEWEEFATGCIARLSLEQKKKLLERVKARRSERLSGARDYAFFGLLLALPIRASQLRHLRLDECVCRNGEPVEIRSTGPGCQAVRTYSLEGKDMFIVSARQALRQWLALRERIRRYSDQQRFFERSDGWTQSPYVFPAPDGTPLSQRIDYRLTEGMPKRPRNDRCVNPPKTFGAEMEDEFSDPCSPTRKRGASSEVRENNHRGRAKPSASHRRAMILLDSEPIRRAARKVYEKVRRSLKAAEEVIEVHERIDEPAYQRWYHQEYGKLLTELRELRDNCSDKELLAAEISEYLHLRGGSFAEASDYVRRRRVNPNDPEFRPPPMSGAEDDHSFPPNMEEMASHYRRMSDKEKEAFEELYEDIREAFEAHYGFTPPPLQDMAGDVPEPECRSSRQEQGDHMTKVKACYRAIVRRLHPDRNREFTSEQKELWNHAQKAYTDNDLTALEVILARCEAQDTGVGTALRVSLLREMTEQVQEQLDAVRETIAQLQRRPSWRFTSETDHFKLRCQMKDELDGMIREVRHRLEWATRRLQGLEEEYAPWSGRQSSPKRRRTRRMF